MSFLRVTLLVTLENKNAFKLVKWTYILDTLADFAVPKYLIRVIQSDRVLFYETLQGKSRKVLISVAAQGSILGPDICSISCDGVRKLRLPNGCFMTGYEDDIALI